MGSPSMARTFSGDMPNDKTGAAAVSGWLMPSFAEMSADVVPGDNDSGAMFHNKTLAAAAATRMSSFECERRAAMEGSGGRDIRAVTSGATIRGAAAAPGRRP